MIRNESSAQFDMPYRPPPVSPEQFEGGLPDGGTIKERIGTVVDAVWPVGLVDGEPVLRKGQHATIDPSYREHQRDAVIDVLHRLYVKDIDVVKLSAPTGAGKSLILYGVVAALDRIAGGQAFTTTPLNSLIDQMDSDEFLDDVLTIKGRNNYDCIHPDDRGTPVDSAICQRNSNFECQYKDRPHTVGGCPYYGRKITARNKANVITNLSFLMANSMIPDEADSKLAPRNLLPIDECQRIEDFAMTFIGVTVSKKSVPINWDNVDHPWPGEQSSMDDAIEWLREIRTVAATTLSELESKNMVTSHEQDRRDELKRWVRKVDNFIADVTDHHWTKTHDSFGGTRKIEFKPIFIGRFLDSFLWDQSDKVILSSATIPNGGFLEEIGLSDKSTTKVAVPSTFPVERRPVIVDRAVGKMTYRERDQTLPKMADEIARLADQWDGYRGFVHCHSYKIAERLYDRLPHDVKQRTRLQDGSDREASLDDWMDAAVSETGPYRDKGGQVFLSVSMEEGISLDDDLCRWQVVAKAAYPHMQDERVAYRMDSDTMDGADWTWYSSSAAIALQQATGRGMRSKDDWCVTYLLDTSLLTLIDKNEYLFEDWFLDAIQRDEGWPDVCEEIEYARDPTVDSFGDGTGNPELDKIAQGLE